MCTCAVFFLGYHWGFVYLIVLKRRQCTSLCVSFVHYDMLLCSAVKQPVPVCVFQQVRYYHSCIEYKLELSGQVTTYE